MAARAPLRPMRPLARLRCGRPGRSREARLARSRVIRDPVYGYITLPNELAGVVDHPLFQRLRRVSQTSLSNAVYPGASGTRFEHALGTMHLAQRAWRSAWENAYPPDARTAFVLAVRASIPSTGRSTEISVPQFTRQLSLRSDVSDCCMTLGILRSPMPSRTSSKASLPIVLGSYPQIRTPLRTCYRSPPA